jgi:hypothetical protein
MDSVSMSFTRGAACVAGLLIAGCVLAQPISPAENLLFETNHLEGIQAPVALTYAYKKEAAAEPGFDDEVQVQVEKINPDRSAAVSVRFLSGDRNIALPDLAEARGNPALLGFLERDIAEMKRLTGGSVNYFRKRIRLALSAVQELHPVRFTYRGKEHQGQEVQIQPYLNDPMRDRFPAYEKKSYQFIISDQVPGRVYRLRTSSAGETAKAGIVETMTLVKDQPKDQSKDEGGPSGKK